MLWAEHLSVCIDDHIVEDLASLLHAVVKIVFKFLINDCMFNIFTFFLTWVQDFIGVNIAGPNEHLLKLKDVQSDVIVVAQELVLVECRLELEVLASHSIDGRLLINCQIRDFFN